MTGAYRTVQANERYGAMRQGDHKGSPFRVGFFVKPLWKAFGRVGAGVEEMFRKFKLD